MRRLIINADDLGINPPRSHGIFEAFENGVVTNATLIANGSHSDQAAKHAREKNLPTGLHLSLTEGYPLSKPEHVSSLLHSDGTFFDRDVLRRVLEEGKV